MEAQNININNNILEYMLLFHEDILINTIGHCNYNINRKKEEQEKVYELIKIKNKIKNKLYNTNNYGLTRCSTTTEYFIDQLFINGLGTKRQAYRK